MTDEEKIKGEEFGNVLLELGFYSSNVERYGTTFCNCWKMKDALGEEHWIADLIDTLSTSDVVFNPTIYKQQIEKNENGIHITEKMINNEFDIFVPKTVEELRNILNEIILLFKQVKIEVSKEKLSKDFEPEM